MVTSTQFLLPMVSNILEKKFPNQLLTFFENNNLLANSQHGFRPKLLTQTALTVTYDTAYTNMDEKKISLLTL